MKISRQIAMNVAKMLGIPSTMLSGGGNEEDDKKFIKLLRYESVR